MKKINSIVQLSKVMAVALRHDPRSFGLELDSEGWVETEQLLAALRKQSWRKDLIEEDFHKVIESSEKKRYEIVDGRIRALYGHSTPEKIAKEVANPPRFLYHGTARKNLDAILEKGILPMSRQYVHLSKDEETALRVGRRKASDVVLLKIDTEKSRLKYYYGNDQTWLADEISPDSIEVIRSLDS